MELEDIKQLISVLKSEGLSEITLWEGDSGITLRSGGPSAGPIVTPSDGEVAEPAQDDGTFTVPAPLVGVFYRRPAPEEAVFVEEGEVIEPGAVLGIIESMKVMNEIRAEEAGRLRGILVEDGESVEYGQPLFVFERP